MKSTHSYQTYVMSWKVISKIRQQESFGYTSYAHELPPHPQTKKGGGGGEQKGLLHSWIKLCGLTPEKGSGCTN